MIKNISQIEKQIKLYEQIKKIDSDIIQLEKLAILINGGSDATIKISVQKPAAAEAPKVDAPQEGGPGMVFFGFRDFISRMEGVQRGASDDAEIFETPISDILTFEVLGLLLQKKIELRDSLINKINSL